MPNISFELPVQDLQRSSTFYERVFGWSARHLPDVDYTLIMASDHRASADDEVGTIVGGMTSRSELVKAPVPIIGVDSLDETLERVRRAGGRQLTGKERVGDFGFSSYIEDSEGNTLCLWEDA